MTNVNFRRVLFDMSPEVPQFKVMKNDAKF